MPRVYATCPRLASTEGTFICKEWNVSFPLLLSEPAIDRHLKEPGASTRGKWLVLLILRTMYFYWIIQARNLTKAFSNSFFFYVLVKYLKNKPTPLALRTPLLWAPRYYGQELQILEKPWSECVRLLIAWVGCISVKGKSYEARQTSLLHVFVSVFGPDRETSNREVSFHLFNDRVWSTK